MSNAAHAFSSLLSQRERGASSARAGAGEISNLRLPPALRQFARGLRTQQTDAEALMWQLLRDRRFFGHKFRRQHPAPPYVLDFYCDELKLAVELDGGQHNEDSAQVRDERRTHQLEARGLAVVRYWNHDVLANTEAVLEDLMFRVLEISPSPPAPLPLGEGSKNPSPSGRGAGVRERPSRKSMKDSP